MAKTKKTKKPIKKSPPIKSKGLHHVTVRPAASPIEALRALTKDPIFKAMFDLTTRRRVNTAVNTVDAAIEELRSDLDSERTQHMYARNALAALKAKTQKPLLPTIVPDAIAASDAAFDAKMRARINEDAWDGVPPDCIEDNAEAEAEELIAENDAIAAVDEATRGGEAEPEFDDDAGAIEGEGDDELDDEDEEITYALAKGERTNLFDETGNDGDAEEPNEDDDGDGLTVVDEEIVEGGSADAVPEV
jgi:hypothetical protein